MRTIGLSHSQLDTLISAVETQFDIESDVVLDDLWPDANVTAVSVDELKDMRKQIGERLTKLLATQEMWITLRHLKSSPPR